MAKLKTDSPLSRRIARSFLEFLDSVEPGAGIDLEGIDVARECLAEAFKLDSSPTGIDPTKTDSLIDIFTSIEENEKNQAVKSGTSSSAASSKAPSSSSTKNAANGDSWTNESSGKGVSRDELLWQYFSALEKIHFFRAMPDGHDDEDQLDKATRLFDDSVNEMEKSGCQVYNQNTLAEVLKSQGNKAMQSKLYPDAVDLYSIAIALNENNAVYYCNRAAAYTHLNKLDEAIKDSLKSIEIDPNYSKGYSRLGLAYYAQGNYHDAIEKGYKKALELDPSNESVKENMRVAEQKLRVRQRYQWMQGEWGQGTSSNPNPQSAGGPASHGIPPSYTSFTLPPEATNNIIGRMFSTATAAGQQPSPRQQGEDNSNGNGQHNVPPGISMSGPNINLDFGEMPSDLSGALRSVMGMFSSGDVNASFPIFQDIAANGQSGSAPPPPPPPHGDSQNNSN
ncbi:hypothetical protein ACFE04_025702 [Oxalis oulophora]